MCMSECLLPGVFAEVVCVCMSECLLPGVFAEVVCVCMSECLLPWVFAEVAPHTQCDRPVAHHLLQIRRLRVAVVRSF